MESRTFRIAALLLLMWLGGCTRYDAEISRLTRRVEVVAFYKWQDRRRRTTMGTHSRVEIRVDGKPRWAFEERRAWVQTVFVTGERVFVLLYTPLPDWREVLAIVCADGKHREIWDLTDLLVSRDAILDSVDCEPGPGGSFSVTIEYHRTVDGDEVDETVRRMTLRVKDPPCNALVVENDEALSGRPRVACKDVVKVGPWVFGLD